MTSDSTYNKKDLGIYVISWNRPHFLTQTIASLKEQVAKDSLSADIHIIDNGSNDETRQAISKIDGVESILFDSNRNICGGYQDGVPEDVDKRYKYILTSDHDILYTEPLSTYVRMLEETPLCWMAKGHNNPLHKIADRTTVHGREWFIKKTCSGGVAVMRTEDWQHKLRPLRCGQQYDWHICGKMEEVNPAFSIYVLPGTTLHIGWRKGDSTWQPYKEIVGDQYQGSRGY